MSFHVFFDFSNGLRTTLRVPKGTKASILAHVRGVEKTLSLRVEQPMHENDMPHWNNWAPNWRKGFPEVPDELLCQTVEKHNRWVEYLYDQIAGWSDKPVEGGEDLTPADAREFWPGLRMLKVDIDRWTRDYFVARMQALYEVMRGREAEGMTFDAKALTERQAAAVIRIFDQYLDPADMRLDVPKGEDYLASSYDGGYDWCERCGAVGPDYACTRRKCPLEAGR